MNRLVSLIAVSALALVLSLPGRVSADDGEEYLLYFMKLIEKEPKEELPVQKILVKNEILFCTGESEAAVANNRAADLMKEGKYKDAIPVLEEGLLHAPLFVPFRYNLGLCYIFENNFKMALYSFERARAMVPEFSRIYLHTGYIFQRQNKINSAIDEYRKALKYNPKELNALIYIGDIYFDRNQLVAAKEYYDAVLAVDGMFPNGLLGSAKIHFRREKFVQTIVLLKSVDLTRDYDKALHFYWGESAYKMRDYKTAVEQYGMLLKFRNDRFFLTNSAVRIEHKLELARRFVDK